MNLFNKTKKGQSLPLNTIVIAILVIIVLLVIIVFFVVKFGEQSGQAGSATENLKKCTVDNPTISGLGYTGTTVVDGDGASCPSGQTRIYQVVLDNAVCCAYKTTSAEDTASGGDATTREAINAVNQY